MSRWFPLVLVIACAPKQAPPPHAAPPDQADTPVLQLEAPMHDSATAVQMHDWLQLAEAARAHLAHGDLQAARTAAASMAATPPASQLPPVWRPFVSDLLVEATALSEAESVGVASRHVGRMGLACGTCHMEADVRDQVAVVALPPEMYDEDQRMDNHQWGADWMWFGLVTSDLQAYRLGATTLTDPHLPAPPESVSGSELLTLLGFVGDVAGRATSSDDDEERALLYGDLLASCATCHAQVHIE